MSQFVDLDAVATLLAVEDRRVARRRAEVEDLALAVHWVGMHGDDPADEPGARSGRGGPRLVRVGGEGTPPVQDLCVAELGTARESHALAARALVADGLDLVFRLPRCQAVLASLVCEPWVARRVASMTRHLSAVEAGYVDRAVAPVLAGEQPSVVLGVAGAKVIEANPAAYRARLDAQERRKYVALGKMSDGGLRHVIAQIDAGDAVYVDAVIARVAEILKARDATAGRDPRDRDERRAAAFGFLARPAELLRLLLEHAHEADLPDLADDDPDPEGDDEHDVAGDAFNPDVAGDGADSDPAAEGDPGPMPTPDPGDDPDAGLVAWSRGGDADDPDAPDAAGGPEEPEDEVGAGWLSGFPAAFLDVLRGMDPVKLRPDATLYVHLHQAALATSTPTGKGKGGVVNVEGAGPCLPEHLASLLGDTLVRVSEVVDLNHQTPLSTYVHPQWLKDQVQLISPRTAFPHSTTISRRVDYDHPVPFRHRDPVLPGQTGLHNSAPLGRYQHRVKTHAQWSVREPGPGSYVWRTPHGLFRLVDATGTHRLQPALGRALFAADPADHARQRRLLTHRWPLTWITPADLDGLTLEIADDYQQGDYGQAS